MGNGGSIPVATHFAGDLAKYPTVEGKPRFKALCLNDNAPMISALTNDKGFSSIFYEQLVPWLEEGDVIIAFSVHGGAGHGEAGPWSQNLGQAVQLAKERKAKVIGFSGDTGGMLKEGADACVVIPTASKDNITPHVEGWHVILAHLIVHRLLKMVGENSMKEKAVFLDRDGVVNQMHYDKDHGIIDSPLSPDQFVLMTGIDKLITTAKNLGYKVIIVSNQPVVAKGKTTLNNLDQITQKMIDELKKRKSEVDDIIYCLHHPEAKNAKYRVDCQCRKPKPGMLLQARDKYNIDLEKSIMVGDGIVDIQAGKNVGCRTILIASDKIDLQEFLTKANVQPDFIAKDIYEASNYLSKI
jgi:D,D-heptose 1,7-bisphosphate phosphatase